MKRLFLIRHAKSSWADEDLDDFDRPLNKRGKKNGKEMARRLAERGVVPDTILSSPARRAKKTARYMAKGVGYSLSDISYHEGLYFGSVAYYLTLLEREFEKSDTIFLVGHNYTITEMAEYLTSTVIENVPTCGIVAVEYGDDQGFSSESGAGRLLFFDFPKNLSAA